MNKVLTVLAFAMSALLASTSVTNAEPKIDPNAMTIVNAEDSGELMLASDSGDQGCFGHG